MLTMNIQMKTFIYYHMLHKQLLVTIYLCHVFYVIRFRFHYFVYLVCDINPTTKIAFLLACLNIVCAT